MQCHELPQLPGLPVAEATGARQECMVRVCGGPAARCQRLDKVQQHCFRHDGADVNRLRRVLSAAALLARVYSDDTVTLVDFLNNRVAAGHPRQIGTGLVGSCCGAALAAVFLNNGLPRGTPGKLVPALSGAAAEQLWPQFF